MAQLKDLIVNGPSRFIGDVYATTFTGNLAGNANTATNATNAGMIAGLSVHSGRNNEANKIVRTDRNGYLLVGYINSSSGHEKNASNPTYVWGSNSSDSYLRSYQTSSLSVNYATSSGSCSGNAATATNADQVDNMHANDLHNWVLGTNMTYTASTRTFTNTRTTSDWATQFYSHTCFKDNCYISFRGVGTDNYRMVGLNSDPTTNAHYTSIDYCWYLQSNRSLTIYENGSNIGSISGHTTYADGDEFRIEYSGGNVRYYHNGVLCRTAARAIGSPLYADCSFYNGGSIRDVEFGSIPYYVLNSNYATTSGSCSGNAATATNASSAGNADKLDGYHLSQITPVVTKRDFTNGTLVKTNISFPGTNTSVSEPFLLTVRGNGYGEGIINFEFQGYVYYAKSYTHPKIISSDFIIYSPNSIDKIYTMSIDNKLCFWWARQSYWQGFHIFCTTNTESYQNRVTEVQDVSKPSGLFEQIYTPKLSLTTSNYTSYTVTKTGGGASGTWGISISGNAATATNADTLDGYHASYANSKPWGTIPVITNGGYMDVGNSFEFHYDNTTGSDYSTVLACTGNYRNIISLPSKNGTLALLTDNVASATKLANSRTIWGQSFDGTGNVSGALTGVTDITASGNATVAGDVGCSNLILQYGGKIYNNGERYGLYVSSAAGDYGSAIYLTHDHGKNQTAFRIHSHYDSSLGGLSIGFSTTTQNYGASPLDATYANIVHIRGNGNVGIGTTSPSYKLDVNGDAHSSGSLYVGTKSGATLKLLCSDLNYIEAGTARGFLGFTVNGGGYSNLAMQINTDKSIAAYGNITTSGGITASSTIQTSGQICINTSSSQRNNYNEGIRCNLGGSDNWASVVLGGASGSTNGTGSGVYSLLVNSSLFRIRQNSTEVLCINTSNNVGIGTTSPSYKLHVVGDGYFTDNVITESDFISRGDAVIDGNIGIGTQRPDYNLDVYGNMRITGPIWLDVLNSNGKYFISTEDNGLLGITYDGRDQNPAFLMNSLGYVYLNCETTESPAYPLVVNGTIQCTKLLQTSDIKYKTNIKQIKYEEALKIIENLNPVTWDWNENTVETGSSSGFVAQEAEEFIPNAISRDNENNLSLDYTQLHSYEIKVIQEQQKEIIKLKEKLKILEKLIS